MRRARAHGSSCSQVILVCLHPFCRSSLLCSHKLPKNHLFWGIKIINVDISKKLVVSACYDKQHVCAYLQPFSQFSFSPFTACRYLSLVQKYSQSNSKVVVKCIKFWTFFALPNFKGAVPLKSRTHVITPAERHITW